MEEGPLNMPIALVNVPGVTATLESSTQRMSCVASLYGRIRLLTLGLTPTSSSPNRALYYDRLVHTTMGENAPIITFASTFGYREINSRTTGSASSCSSATDNKISKFG